MSSSLVLNQVSPSDIFTIAHMIILPSGSIPWFMVAEMFLQDACPAAVTMAVIVNWTTNFAVGLSFPIILVTMGNQGDIHYITVILYRMNCIHMLSWYLQHCAVSFGYLLSCLCQRLKGKPVVKDIVSKFKSSLTNFRYQFLLYQEVYLLNCVNL